MKRKITAGILLLIASLLVALLLTPIGYPLMNTAIFGKETDTSPIWTISTSTNVPEAYLDYMNAAITQEAFILCFLPFWLICFVVILICITLGQKPSREVENGVLGDARLIDNYIERRRKNDYWDGNGTPPGPSLVYGFERGHLIGDSEYTHGFAAAVTGGGKSRFIGLFSLFWNIAAGASVVYTARKMTDYELTHSAAEKNGIKTFLIDLEQPKRGNRFNLMDTVNAFINAGDIASAQKEARRLSADFIAQDTNHPHFSNAARALMTAAILIVALADIEPKDKNLISVATLLRGGVTGTGKDPASPFKDYVRSLGASHPAYKAAAEFLQDDGTEAGRNTVSTLLTGITMLGDEGLEWMLSGSDFTLEQLLEEQCILYPHCLGEGDPYNVILSAMYNQLWALAQQKATAQGGKLNHPFVILGDEWGNLPRVSSLGEMISLGRSMDFHAFLFVQNLKQFAKYNDAGDGGAGMEKLLGSMSLQIVMSVMHPETDGKYFEAICGNQTIRTQTQATNRRGYGVNSKTGSSESYSEHAVPIVPAASLKERVPLRDGIIVVKGGVNTAPGHEGVFKMPVADATKSKPVKHYFGLGNKEQDQAKCLEEERLLNARALNVDPTINCWCPNFEQTKSEKTHFEDIEDDEFGMWDERS